MVQREFLFQDNKMENDRKTPNTLLWASATGTGTPTFTCVHHIHNTYIHTKENELSCRAELVKGTASVPVAHTEKPKGTGFHL